MTRIVVILPFAQDLASRLKLTSWRMTRIDRAQMTALTLFDCIGSMAGCQEIYANDLRILIETDHSLMFTPVYVYSFTYPSTSAILLHFRQTQGVLKIV